MAEFGAMLVDQGITRGLIGPREATRIWDRHLVNCAGVSALLPTSGTILDLGSGAGLPGIVIAIMRPQQPVVLLESLLRRTNWLSEVAQTLSLDNVTVYRGRAGEKLDIPLVAAVTARAVAPLSKLLSWSAPLVRKDGGLYALKGETAAAEVAELDQSGAKRFTRDWKLPPEIHEQPTLRGVTPTTVVKVMRK